MKIAYFDCFAGISGDMVLASLIDSGLDFHDFLDKLRKSKLGIFSLTRKKIRREEISATQISINSRSKTSYSYLEFLKILRNSRLPASIKKRSINTFNKLAGAEKKVHGVKEKDFHFEQLGEIDTLVDIVGTHIALYSLKIEKVYFSRIKIARGGVFKHDGKKLPLPGPAVLELLKGISLELTDEPFEYVTPTGAALVSSLISGTTHNLPIFRMLRVGYGAGTKKFGNQSNVLRVIIGEFVSKKSSR